MEANNQFSATARWLRYAEEDLITAETLLEQPRIVPRQACWLAQQAAEKAIKAVLVFLQIDFPRTHDLDALRNLIPVDWQLKTAHPDLASLSEWAVEARYPSEWEEPTKTMRTMLLSKHVLSGHQYQQRSHNGKNNKEMVQHLYRAYSCGRRY